MFNLLQFFKIFCRSSALLFVISLILSATPVFAGVTAKQSVEAALRSNPTIKAFKENAAAAKHDVRSARGGWFPRLDVNAGYGVEQTDNLSTRRTDDDDDWDERSDISVSLTQLLWDGGKVGGEVGIQKAKLANVDSRLLDNVEALALEAIRAHLELYRQRNLVRLAEQNVANHEDILASQEERQRLGAISLADVSQTKGRLARARASLSNIQQELLRAEAGYKRIVGMDAPEVEWVDVPTNVPDTFESALQFTLAGNHKIAAQQAQIDENEQRIRRAKAEYYPTFSARASSDYQDQVESDTSWSNNTILQLRMAWNIYRGGSDYAAVKAESARKRQAVVELQDVNEALIQETRNTWYALENAQEQKRLFAEAVEYNAATRDMYVEQFSVGQRSLLDVLDAENELFSSSLQMVTATVNEIIAKYRLVTLGGNIVSSMGFDSSVYMTQASK